MPTPILMPALSPTMTEGNLAKWLKNEGDTVRSGDVIAEIETDKATMEVEAVDEGTLGKILVPAGTEGVAVNTPIAMLLNDGESPSALDGATPESEAGPEARQPPAEEAKPAATPALPRSVKRTAEPEVPARLFRRGGGRVELLVDVLIDTDGSVKSAVVITSSNADADEPVLDAVRRWRYEPQPAARPHQVRLVVSPP